MSADEERMDAAAGRLLRRLRLLGGRDDYQSQARQTLELIQEEVPDALGAFLLSTVPLSKPERPIRSSGWRPEAFQEPEQLRVLAEYLSECEATKYVSLHTAPAVDWLPRHLLKPGATVLAICPLRQLAPRDFRDAPGLGLVLAVALSTRADSSTEAGARQEPHKKHLELLAWLLAQIRINWEAAAIARRSVTRAEAIDQGTHQLLAQAPMPSDVREHFRELVDRIQPLMNCDTCQLYLLPRYAEGTEAEQLDDRIWLAAEKTADRETLRYKQSDPSLIVDLWRDPDLSPLNVTNLMDDEKFGKHALGKLGLTRHFLGMLLKAPSAKEGLGVIVLRDKFEPDPEDYGHNAIAQTGFTQRDVETLQRRAGELMLFLKQNEGELRDERKGQVRRRVEALRADLSADTCQLYLTPHVIGVDRVEEEPYLDLFINARRDWAGDASYGRGEGLTGIVFETGKDQTVEDGLRQWRELEREAEETDRRRPGKYRVSQHLLAVKIAPPPFLPNSGHSSKPIGVLKVRDRLRSDGKTLSHQPFSSEDLHVLRAFAHMISVEIAMSEYARRRKIEEMLRLCYMTDEFHHDVVGNLHRPFEINWASREDRPSDLSWLSEYLKDMARLFNRSWVAARIAAGIHEPKKNAQSDLAAVLRELFPKPETYLSPDRNKSEADVRLSAPEPRLTDPLDIRCERELIELVVLVLPIWLYHYADVGPEPRPLQVDISAEPFGRGAKLWFKASLASQWCDRAPRPSEDITYFVNYGKRLVCPSIPFNAFQNQLSFYGARLRGNCAGGETQIWIEFDRVAEQGGKERL